MSFFVDLIAVYVHVFICRAAILLYMHLYEDHCSLLIFIWTVGLQFVMHLFVDPDCNLSALICRTVVLYAFICRYRIQSTSFFLYDFCSRCIYLKIMTAVYP
jgi:hypothetical protein